MLNSTFGEMKLRCDLGIGHPTSAQLADKFSASTQVIICEPTAFQGVERESEHKRTRIQPRFLWARMKPA